MAKHHNHRPRCKDTVNGNEEGKVSAWWLVAALLIGIALGIFVGTNFLTGTVGKGLPNEEIPVGEHQIVALITVESDYALVVLDRGDTESEPCYYKVKKEEVVNFEDASSATKLIKISETNLEYIEFE